MSACPCPGPVPVISRKLARSLLRRFPEPQRVTVLQAAFQWLTAKHPGLTIYAGINGRVYTFEEKKAIATEVGLVSQLPCPFYTKDGCLLGGLGPHYNRVEEMGKAPYGWLPTLVAALWSEEELRYLARRGTIADAKIAMLSRNEAFY